MNTRRSIGKVQVARALWYAKQGVVEMRHSRLSPLPKGFARVRTLFSGISRGTERLVASGSIAPSEWERMKGPNQEGAFPFPVKYGYCATGIVEEGPADLLGKTVFCLHPHQDVFDAKLEELAVIPDGIPARRATLTANMETALNALWDGGAGPGRVARAVRGARSTRPRSWPTISKAWPPSSADRACHAPRAGPDQTRPA